MRPSVKGARFPAVRAILIVLLSLPFRPRAADNVVFVEPVAGSVHHVGELLHVKLKLADSDTSWGNQLFDLLLEGGKRRVDMGLTAGSSHADSMKVYITEHKEFDWVIPDSVLGGGGVMLGTVGNACAIRTRPYNSGGTPYGANGTSGTFTIAPAGAAIRDSRLAINPNRPAAFSSLRWIGGAAGRLVNSPKNRVLILSCDGRLRQALRHGPGDLPGSGNGLGAGIYIVETQATQKGEP